jgi:copper chaperone
LNIRGNLESYRLYPRQRETPEAAMRIEVDNIKCGGCANSIRKGLLEVPGVAGVVVDIEGGAVDVDADPAVRAEVVARLVGMGYPETGTAHGLKSAGLKARSFVSCAVGRVTKTDDA